MTETERLAELVTDLVDGWFERVEHVVRITVHTRMCQARMVNMHQAELRHFCCECPVHFEGRVSSVRQPSLIRQLLGEVSGFAPTTMGARWGQPGSRPPGTLDLLDLVDSVDRYLVVIKAEGRGRLEKLRNLVSKSGIWGDEWTREVCSDLRRFIKTARIMLQYDVPKRALRDTVCGECGGTLVVAADADSDVRCVGTEDVAPCGTVYPRWRWVDLLEEA